MTALKVGDHVSVAYAATVVEAETLGGVVEIEDERGISHRVAASQCTKIPDPEPEWNRGDVVKYKLARAPDGEAYPALFNGDRWVDVDRDIVTADEMSGHWQAGRVEIVHRAAVQS